MAHVTELLKLGAGALTLRLNLLRQLCVFQDLLLQASPLDVAAHRRCEDALRVLRRQLTGEVRPQTAV